MAKKQARSDINQLRLLSLFEGSKVGENRVKPPVFGAPTPPPGDIDAEQSYEDLFPPDDIRNARQPNIPDPDSLNYTPETADTELYRKHIGEMPEYEDPGIWDRLIAGGLTLGNRRRGIPGGYEQGKKYLEAPYDRDMEAWKAKAQPLGAAATLENARNVNARQMAGYELRDKQFYAKQAETERSNKAKEENANIRARAYSYAQYLGKGYQFDFSGPTVKLGNKTTGDVMDTGLETGKLDEQTRIELQNAGRIEAARVTGENAANRIQQGGTNIFQDPKTGKRYIPDPDNPGTLKEVIGGPADSIYKPGTTPSSSSPNMLEQDRIRQEKMNRLYNEIPATQKYIKTRDKGKTFTMEPRPKIKAGGFFGTGYGPGAGVTQADIDEWDKINKEIYPDYVAPPPDKATTTTIQTPQNKTPTAPTRQPTPNNTPIGPTTVPVPPSGGNQLPGKPPTSSWGVKPPTPQMGPQEQKAAEFLKQNGQAVTPANIQHAIQQGWVQ